MLNDGAGNDGGELLSQLLQVRTRRVVLIGRGLLREPQGPLPLRHRGVREFRRQARERNRIAGVQGRLVLPELLHASRDLIRGATTERFTHRLDGGPFAGGHQGTRGALDLGVGHGWGHFNKGII
jgi:hypothetical protein